MRSEAAGRLGVLMENFRRFLDRSYENIEVIYHFLDWDDHCDWGQEWQERNFDMMVLDHIKDDESVICAYGCTSYQLSRYREHGKPIFRIACMIDTRAVWFVSFTGCKNGHRYDKAPYDYVIVESSDRQLYDVPIERVEGYALLPYRPKGGR
jgi:hypothetical protein